MSTRTPRKHEGSEILVVEVPKRTPKRFRWLEDRVLIVDMRGIRPPWNGAINHRVNRKKFNCPEDLEAKCNEYFASCDGVLYNHKTGQPYLDKNGFPVTGQIKPYTISGLALYLDISTESLKLYERGLMDDIGVDEYELPQYSKVVRKARQRIEAYAESRLYDKDGYNGSKFVLDCAFNWISNKERSDIENHRATQELKNKEFELKKKLLEGSNEDESITITVTRASKE